jgi:hypothetical protein
MRVAKEGGIHLIELRATRHRIVTEGSSMHGHVAGEHVIEISLATGILSRPRIKTATRNSHTKVFSFALEGCGKLADVDRYVAWRLGQKDLDS